MKSNALPNDPDQLKAMLLSMQEQVARLAATITEQQQKLEQKEQLILELLRVLRGKKRERINPDQLLLFEIGELESMIKEAQQDNQESERPSKKKSKPHGRRLIPDNLPREVIEHKLPESERLCPIDGKPMEPIRWEESKQLDYVPAKMRVIVHRRAVYACSTKHDEAKLVTAPMPPQPIEKGLCSPGLLAQVVVSKFGDHLPGYRLEDIFSRHKIDIRRSTIYDWLSGAADLALPLVNLMKRQVLESKVIHTDDTQVKLIDLVIHGTRLARFWCYLGDAKHPYAVYDFTSNRSRTGPERFLTDYRGYLQADAYGGYDGIYSRDGTSQDQDANEAESQEVMESAGGGESKPPGVIEVACWAHCRRYWYKAREQDPARAHYVLAVISRLYEVERACDGRDAEFRKAMRIKHAVPLLDVLEQWLSEQQMLPKSLSGKAATYTRNQWQALRQYTQDGELSIDNNFAERAMRPVAIGRKNWLFVGSVNAGRRSAVLMSLIASCKANEVEPWAYLKDIFTRLPQGLSEDELRSLLPDLWLTANPDHRWEIAKQRKVERKQK
jgi:transposase